MSDSPALRGAAVAVGVLLAAVAVVAVATAVLAVVAVWFCVRHPRVAGAVAVSAVAAANGGLPAAVALWGITVAGLLFLRSHRRAAFDRHVLPRWRRATVYGWRWRRVMWDCDLGRPGRVGRRRVPRLGAVRSSRWSDVLSVHPLEGHTVEAFADRVDEIGRRFGALSCRVDTDATGTVRLELWRGDPLRSQLTPAAVPPCPDRTALPLGRREDGSPWTVSLDDGHLLVVGPPADARTVIWALLRSVAVPVRDGAVEVWAVDGSGGIALAAGSSMFTRTAIDPSDAATLVERLLAERGARRGLAPRAVASSTAPLTLLALHDLGRFGRTIDRHVHGRLVAAIDLALDYGPGLGIVVVATAPEEPGDIALRFPQRITLGAPGTDRVGVPEVGTAVVGGSAMRVRVHRITEDEMGVIAAAHPARSSVEHAPTDGALERRVVA